jgi:hypothetical protein
LGKMCLYREAIARYSLTVVPTIVDISIGNQARKRTSRVDEDQQIHAINENAKQLRSGRDTCDMLVL